MFRLGQRPETEAEFRERMVQLERQMEALDQKTPEEVVGDPMEDIYYGRMLAKALTAGEYEAARPLIRTILQLKPHNGLIRLIAATAYHQLGEPGEEALQLAVALALDGENYALHTRLARLLLKRGERETAVAILEQGWLHQKKHLARKDHAAARARYFGVLDEAPTGGPMGGSGGNGCP